MGDEAGKIALEALGVRKSYAKDGRTLPSSTSSRAVRDGEFVTVIGPSGCGKSTRCFTMGGFIPAEAVRSASTATR